MATNAKHPIFHKRGRPGDGKTERCTAWQDSERNPGARCNKAQGHSGAHNFVQTFDTSHGRRYGD